MTDFCLIMMKGVVWGITEEEALLCWCLARLGLHLLELQNQLQFLLSQSWSLSFIHNVRRQQQGQPVLPWLLVREIKEEEGQLRVAGDRQGEEDVSLDMKLFMIINNYNL